MNLRRLYSSPVNRFHDFSTISSPFSRKIHIEKHFFCISRNHDSRFTVLLITMAVWKSCPVVHTSNGSVNSRSRKIHTLKQCPTFNGITFQSLSRPIPVNVKSRKNCPIFHSKLQEIGKIVIHGFHSSR